MTDGRRPTPGCVDSETMAAFLDGRLEPRERAAVEAHLADCEDCYEVWMDAQAITETCVAAAAGTAALPRRAWRPVVWTVAAAAAVVLAVVWMRPVSDEARTQRAVHALVSAVGSSRPALGRFSVGFAWAAVVPPTRSSESVSVPLPVQQAALSIRVLASEIKSAATTRAFGIAEITEGRIDAGIRALEESVAAEPANADFHADLSAALLERWSRHRVAEDAAKALNQAQLAVNTSPDHVAGLFNLALAAEAVGDRVGAVRAWKSFLSKDATSEWAAEARRRLEELERANQAPVQMTQLRERRLLEWANAMVAGRRAPLADPDDGGDAVFAAAESATRTGHPNPRQLASAVLTLQRSRERFDQSDHTGAATEARTAAGLFRSIGVNAAEADMQVAWSLFFGQQRAPAMDIARRVAASPQTASLPRVLGRFEYLSGLDALALGLRTQAVHHYNVAIANFERAGDIEQAAAAHALLAEALRNQGDKTSSWQHLSEALTALPALSTPRRRIHILALATQAATQTDQDGAALWFSEGLELAVSETDDPGAHVSLHLLRAPLLVRVGNLKAARLSFAAGREASTQFTDIETQRRYRGEFGWLEGRALHSIDPPAAVRALTEALDAFEPQRLVGRLAEVYLYRGRAYRAGGDRQKAEDDWRAGIDLLRGQAGAIHDRRLRTAWADNLWGLFSEMIDSHADRPMEALAWLEASRMALRSTSGEQPMAIAAVTSPASQLGADVVVVLASLPHHLFKWTLDGNGEQFSKERIDAAELAALCRTFVGALSEGRLPASDVIDRLSALVLPARLPAHADASVVFVADGPLRMFPFGALRVNGRPLLELAAPRVASTFLSATQHRPVAVDLRKPLLVGVSDPGKGSGLQFLPNAKAEVEALGRLYDSRAILLDEQVTRTELLRQMAAPGLIHIATHAVADPQSDRAALVLFSSGALRTLSTDEIVSQRLRSDVVVILSACDTAVTAVTASNSGVSLAHAFLDAGAAAVIGTLWRIADDDARTLMTMVHTNLRNGRPSHLALVDAQRAMLKFKRPVHAWAALVHLSS